LPDETNPVKVVAPEQFFFNSFVLMKEEEKMIRKYYSI